MLDLRGQAGAFAAAGLPVPSFPLGLKGAAINFGRLDSDFPYLLDIPQSQIETLLAGPRHEPGRRIRWSCEVTGIEQDDHEVRVRLAERRKPSGPTTWWAATGLRSFVRQAAGLPFPGAPNPGSVLLADLYLDGLPMTDAYGDLSDRGMLLVFPFRDGSCRTVLYDYARAGGRVSEPVTLDEVRTSLIRVTGQDFGPRDMTWSGRYRSESRQVPAYRAGRVLLAGDAAHTHSPGRGAGHEHRPAGRGEPGLETRRGGGRPGTGLAARLLPRRAVSGGRGRPRADRPPVPAEHGPHGPAPGGALGRAPDGRAAAAGAGLAGRDLLGGGHPVSAGPGRPVPDPALGPVHKLAGARLPRGTLDLAGGGTARLYGLFGEGRFALLEAAGQDDSTGAADCAGPGGPAAAGRAAQAPRTWCAGCATGGAREPGSRPRCWPGRTATLPGHRMSGTPACAPGRPAPRCGPGAAPLEAPPPLKHRPA